MDNKNSNYSNDAGNNFESKKTAQNKKGQNNASNNASNKAPSDVNNSNTDSR